MMGVLYKGDGYLDRYLLDSKSDISLYLLGWVFFCCAVDLHFILEVFRFEHCSRGVISSLGILGRAL